MSNNTQQPLSPNSNTIEIDITAIVNANKKDLLERMASMCSQLIRDSVSNKFKQQIVHGSTGDPRRDLTPEQFQCYRRTEGRQHILYPVLAARTLTEIEKVATEIEEELIKLVPSEYKRLYEIELQKAIQKKAEHDANKHVFAKPKKTGS